MVGQEVAAGEGHQRAQALEHAAALSRFEALGVAEPSEDLLESAVREVAGIESERQSESRRRDDLLTARGDRQRRLQEAEESLETATDKLAVERRETEPAVRRWEALRQRAVAAGLVREEPMLDATRDGIRGHVNLVQEARVRHGALLERLRDARGGVELLADVELRRAESDATFGEGYLDLWLAVRDWLRRRLPAQVAEVDDPAEALTRFDIQSLPRRRQSLG